MASSATMPSPVDAPPNVISLLDRLHALSLEQESNIDTSVFRSDNLDTAMKDKFIALDQDKCHFVYQVARAINAKNIVEAGTSFGVSTIYLGLAVTKNVEATGGSGTVIATEHELSKAELAKKHWAEAGEIVSKHIDLRIGDLRETLKSNLPTLDMLLLDIWTPMALPTLKLVQPHLRYGAVIFADNTIGSAAGYKELLEYMRAPDSGFSNLTVPYHKGFEMSVYLPSRR